MKFLKIRGKLINLGRIESIEIDPEFPCNIDLWIEPDRSVMICCVSPEKKQELFKQITNFIAHDYVEGSYGYGQYGNDFGFSFNNLFDLDIEPSVKKEAQSE